MTDEQTNLPPEDQHQGADQESGTNQTPHEGSAGPQDQAGGGAGSNPPVGDEKPGPTPEEPGGPDAEGGTNWGTIGLIALVGVIVVLALYFVFTALGPGAGSGETPTPSPESTGAPQAAIEIVEPAEGTILDIASPVTVSGVAAGLPEGNVVLQAVDNNDNVLAQTATTINAPDAGIGGAGPWSAQLTIQAEPATPGRILAFSTSPADGSMVASDSIEVSFGASEAVETFITIDSPADGDVLDISQPVVVTGTGGGLFEGNLVVEALDGDGNVLTGTSTIIQSPEAGTGGQGPWTAQLLISTEPGAQGQIKAFSTSPKDGSEVASDTVDVVFGMEEPMPTETTEPPETPQVNIEEHHWELVSYDSTEVLEDTQIGADYGPDGQVSGSAGCNSYTGPYQISGNILLVGPLANTEKFCAEPQGVMDQETTYLSLLQMSDTYHISEGQLLVNDASNKNILTYNAAVTGVVTYLERIALPDDAVVTVQLQDVSLQDVPATVLGEQVIQTAGQQVPIPYVVTYDPSEIQPNHTYSMSVRITDGAGNLLFISDTINPVLTGGNPTHDVEIVTVSVGT